jgi:hypothetical protein
MPCCRVFVLEHLFEYDEFSPGVRQDVNPVSARRAAGRLPDPEDGARCRAVASQLSALCLTPATRRNGRVEKKDTPCVKS